MDRLLTVLPAARGAGNRARSRATELGLLLTAAAVVAACGGGGGNASRPTVAPPSTTGASSTLPPPPPQTTVAGPAMSGFVAFGDFGGGPGQGSVATAMQRWIDAGHRVDALVTTGDNVYEVAQPSLFGPQLDQPYAALRRTRPMWVTLGNHDVAGIYGDAELAHLGLPALPYARELPGVQLLFADANRPDDAQGRWLDQRLSEPGPPMRVVVFHQPAWSCGLHGSTPEVDKRWVPGFEAHRTALVLNGHDHDYERFLSAAGVTYVVTGGGGRELYPTRGRCMDQPDRKAGAVRHHFVGVEVRAHSLTLTAVADDGTVLDRAVLSR